MLVCYDSQTGNVERFISKLGMKTIKIKENMKIEDDFIFVTYTTGFGQVPERTLGFLKRNHNRLLAVAASGNRNWGQSFAKSADIIANMYKVPIIHKFELSGMEQDVKSFIRSIDLLICYP
ncbi:class Ib ribonucleoside-diphosphate reductase assembly flavoprotein NrdI [Bacillus cereus]|uniref:Class Ib ribonucleoside-diphosphate reductase assembly flavoprotein NrdI n=1 Tax=Bacillus cereus TaxID=1396 RepID=A0AAW5L3W1_BACCE|nr:class Ib ribonucleoside-diphosphate reductase assembly flavoprotein NrdI [Bacillus cereus]MCQ6288946.1 class Ib ribonucleoside-diphosphate reductase assembly flavoprotein NrdI [Bacillus cereus]MCQ6318348.1 class Ib ribonucleoside-diphosphate reductase assembly flavoprotein NrdI [Bacillus cereus]MCQ6330030.1 class Ib ribonucleoside-diphosphate reductase assembly flavoprotein NrdI [Bacillus cereus]MCQ6385961.1 class Ib ribonucleoside-diphosphate reductase assembly flavoprotein NrdI [Bacillus c